QLRSILMLSKITTIPQLYNRAKIIQAQIKESPELIIPEQEHPQHGPPMIIIPPTLTLVPTTEEIVPNEQINSCQHPSDQIDHMPDPVLILPPSPMEPIPIPAIEHAIQEEQTNVIQASSDQPDVRPNSLIVSQQLPEPMPIQQPEHIYVPFIEEVIPSEHVSAIQISPDQPGSGPNPEPIPIQ